MMQRESKFYVQSGGVKWVLLSPNIYKAATRFAQVLFQPTMRGQQTLGPKFSLINERAFCKKVQQLGKKIYISQSGFGGPKIGIFDTSEVVELYRNQIQKLESVLRKSA